MSCGPSTWPRLAAGHQAASATARRPAAFSAVSAASASGPAWARELLGDDARVVAGLDGQDGGQGQAALLGLGRVLALEVRRDRQPQDVGRADAEEGGDEGGGDRLAQARRVGQVGQDADQAHDRAEDAEGRRVAAHLGEHVDALGVAGLHRLDLDLEDLLDGVGLEAVDDHLEAVADEGVLDRLDVALESQQAFAAGPLGELDEHLADRADVADPRLHAHARAAWGRS